MHRRFLDTELSMPPSYENNNTHDKFINYANFDTNMVIILFPMLFPLIFLLGLTSIALCVRRCSQRFSQETPERPAARGLKKRDLSQIPVVVYGSGENIPTTECTICLGEFEKGDKLRLLPKCSHGFHVRCIDTWLVSHSSCPNCRHSLLEKQQPTVSSSTSGVARESSPENVVVVVEQAS